MLNGEIVGVVLAGGDGSRIGGDKPGAILAGKTLGDRALDVLESAFEEVVLSVEYGASGACGRRIVRDQRHGLGPLAALEAVLEAFDARSVFLLACDLPMVDRRVVERIARAATAARAAEATATIGASGGRCQPLCGVYSADCLEVVRERLDSRQLSMHGLLGVLTVKEVDLDDLGSNLLMNVNRTEDLERAQRLLNA
jgi:molybdopterin-guanine dinucleotide biosynthesis protein A